jgi:predicted ATPase/DNA-binding winged helix-turn-helix (wHTH) protein
MTDRGGNRALRGARGATFQSGVHAVDAAHGLVAIEPRLLRVFRFGSFVADERLFQLRLLAEPLAVQPKVLELLFYLLRHRERVVTKAELFENLWSGVVVTGASLLYAVKEARKVLGDDASEPRFIRNVRGRGYRFIASVEEGSGPLLRRKELAAHAASEQAPAALRSAAPFVGRDDIMEQLRAQLSHMQERNGVALLLTGDPGIGKTRVAEAFAALARARGAGVLFGRSYEVPGAPPFWPWVQVVRSYLAQHDLRHVKRVMGPFAADIASIVPELRELWSDLPAGVPVENAQGRFRVFDALASFVRNAAEWQPLVLILDDVHRADESSLLLLEYLVNQLDVQRVLVLAMGRSAAVSQDQTLLRVLGEVVRRDPGRHLELHGLPRSEIARLLFESTGKSASEATLAQLSELTSGNPLFLTQVLHVLSAEGRLGRLEAVGGAEDLPAAVTDGLARYLDFLAEPVRRVLSIAAVFGREFSAAPLASVSGLGYELVLECLGEAVRWRVLVDTREVEGPYRFAHVLLRDVLYARLNPAERVRLHRAAAEALLEHYHGAAEPPLAQLAHHFLQAASLGDATRATAYAIAAARSAAERCAYEDAAALCTRALQVADSYGSEPQHRMALRLLLADTQARLRH